MSNAACLHQKPLALAIGAGLFSLLPMTAFSAEAMPVKVTITDKGCEPYSLTVPEGKSTFIVKNESARALEWEKMTGEALAASAAFMVSAETWLRSTSIPSRFISCTTARPNGVRP